MARRGKNSQYERLGIPLAVGVPFEIVVLGTGGVNVPGFTAAFVAVVLHPVVAFVASLGYLFRRRRVG